MGLGKTVQAISVAYLYRHEWPLLIVVPSSMKYPWIEELERWIPELLPDDINLVESKSDIMGISRSKVTVLGYGLLTNDAQSLVDSLKKQRFGVVIVDESHYMKSRNAARTKILVPLIQNTKRAILLTGTPALGRPEELFMQIDALYPRRFGTWSEYAKKYCNAHYRFFGSRRQWDCRGASHLDELHQRLSEIMIRRLKAEVLTQLPAKIRQRIPFDLPKEAAKEASSSLEKWESLMRSVVSGGSENENPFTEVMGLITQMYKQTAIAKAGAVKDYIKMMLETEQLKFLVFAHHLSMLQACTEAAIEAKAAYIRIDGSVPSAERIQLVHRFQNDPETRVAILSIQAAGQGLTLTAATHVVFAELYWNPGHVKQAEDRAHRIGQTSSVHIHYLIAKGTFDMVMWAMLNRKESVTGSTLNGRKEYLRAEEADKEKWDFLNFAQAWTPSDSNVGDAADEKDGVFFSHFEKDKQHDIRNFFSPASDKKRKKTDDASITSSPRTPSQDQRGTNQSPHSRSPDSANQEEDFRPQVKRLKQASPLSRHGGKRSPTMTLATPRGLSAGPQTPRHSQRWSCPLCTFSNSGLLLRCGMCETPRAQKAHSPPAPPSPSTSLSISSPCLTLPDSEEDDSTPKTPSHAGKKEEGKDPGPHGDPADTPSRANDARESEHADDSLPVYDSLKFCASKNTDRIYIYSKGGLPLNCNFVPYLSKQEVAQTSLSAAQREGGTVRSINKDNSSSLKTFIMKPCSQADKESEADTGYLQALDAGGTPLCLSCQKPSVETSGWAGGFCSAGCMEELQLRVKQLQESEADTGYLQALDAGGTPLCLSCQKPSVETSGWAGGFCSAGCMEELQLRSSRGYARSRVLETEQGVCQSCGLNARQLYLRVRDAPHTHRKEILDNTWLAQLPLKQLSQDPAPSLASLDLALSSIDVKAPLKLPESPGAAPRAKNSPRSKSEKGNYAPRNPLGLSRSGSSEYRPRFLFRHKRTDNQGKNRTQALWLNEMIRHPVEGHFWQVDHIKPVYSGGGQCLLDNLQTLCTVCHRMRTSQQAKERSLTKRGEAASKLSSDITRFFVKKSD
ncbi:DNA annealing helicase and endonuclease ZRANB3 [Silurus meridionalis]|nr:DNA annealing helicase and endonuclease ZRANB3 [Silurus meridionalis]